MENIISVKDMTFEYVSIDSKFRAIDNLNLEVKQGEFVAIIGHNGSGKSTLSKNLNAILVPTEGDIYIDGMNTKDEAKLWDIRQTAEMVFQNPDNQIVATIVEEDVAFGPENLGIEPKVIRQRVEESLKSVGIYELKDRQPHLLSGGQKQRVAIAGIIAMRPKCIIFDEATAMLDPSGRKEVMNVIKKLNKEENITTLHITHYMEEAVQADRVVVVDKGKKLLEGTPKEVFKNVDLLKKIGLDVPYMTELAGLLREEGLDIDDDILTVDEMVEDNVRKLNIVTDDIHKRINLLSGGNQQKVVLAKWMNMRPEVMMLDEPTAGVDVGAKAEIIALMRDYAEEGKGVLFVSSELAELMAVCDRIITIYDGRITGEMDRSKIDSEEELQYAIQQK